MKKKKTKLVDFETSCLLKDIGFKEHCYFYYVDGVKLMMSGEKQNHNDSLTQTSVIFTKDGIAWLKSRLSEEDLTLFDIRYGKSVKLKEELRDLEDLNNLINFYKRKYINNGIRI